MKEIVVLLHNIRSVYNVGSIFRTADAAGVGKIYLCGITPAPLDRFGRPRKDFTKVSLGAEKAVRWEKVVSTNRVIDKLRSEGHQILAVEQSPRSVPYYNYRHYRNRRSSKNVVLVLGNEVKGLPKSILRKADKILEIPMKGKKESLNVSVSFGIAVYGIICR